MTSKAKTVAEYLKELPEDRRAAISKVRAVIRKNLPKGFVEEMSYGMIGYVVPHRLYPPGYHCDPKQPLGFAGIASQKNYMAVYLWVYMDAQADRWFRDAYHASGKKLDMGKCCVRFKKLDDLPLDLIGEAIARVSLADYVMRYEDSRKAAGSRKK